MLFISHFCTYFTVRYSWLPEDSRSKLDVNYCRLLLEICRQDLQYLYVRLGHILQSYCRFLQYGLLAGNTHPCCNTCLSCIISISAFHIIGSFVINNVLCCYYFWDWRSPGSRSIRLFRNTRGLNPVFQVFCHHSQWIRRVIMAALQSKWKDGHLIHRLLVIILLTVLTPEIETSYCHRVLLDACQPCQVGRCLFMAHVDAVMVLRPEDTVFEFGKETWLY